jgi:arsenite-transporting ATPase
MKETLEELLESETLKFIFVGGKGGVGKTTTSSSIALAKSKTGKKTLIISTDPAHNLSDAFNQQFTHEPTKVQGCENLYAMEIDPKKSIDISSNLFQNQEVFQGGFNTNFLNDILGSVPGIDEAIVFMDLLRMSKEMQADVVIFDTAPTGHTLKMLSFPDVMQKALEKLMDFKDKINSVFSMFSGNSDNTIENIFSKMEKLKQDTEGLRNIMQNPDLCTFVAVCIPEFLSVYETERLVQELTIQNIDIYNIVVNQIVFYCEEDKCKKCLARYKMQHKYITQIKQLYEDFHLVFMPLEDEEIRGVEKLELYSQKLLQEKTLPKI